MGGSRSVRYTVEMICRSDKLPLGYGTTPAEWRTRRQRAAVPGGYLHVNGAPTEENLATYVKDFERSTEAGGANDHLGKTVVTFAKIVYSENRDVVAIYRA